MYQSPVEQGIQQLQRSLRIQLLDSCCQHLACLAHTSWRRPCGFGQAVAGAQQLLQQPGPDEHTKC
jgi:hypothetical protein